MAQILDRSTTAAAGLRREIADDFKYDKKKLKHLKYILHNVNVSVGTLVSALNQLSGLKGPDISPDGLIGGLGYIMPLKNIKETLNNSIHNLSDVADSLADELTNPHWNSKDDEDVKKLIKEKDTVEDKAEEVLEPQEDIVEPADVKTSTDILENRTASINNVFTAAVQDVLVKFNSIGTRK